MAKVVTFRSKEMLKRLKQAKEFSPIGEWVVICREDSKLKSAGGILIPETAVSNRKMLGVVAATSSKHLSKHDFKFKVGDRVIYAPLSGVEIKIHGDDYFIIKASEILAIVN